MMIPPVWTDVISFSVFPSGSRTSRVCMDLFSTSCPPRCLTSPSLLGSPPGARHYGSLQSLLTSSSSISGYCLQPTVGVTRVPRMPHATASSSVTLTATLSPLLGLDFLVILLFLRAYSQLSPVSPCLCGTIWLNYNPG